MNLSTISVSPPSANSSRTRSRRLETIIYASAWLLIIGLFILDMMRTRSYSRVPLFDLRLTSRMMVRLLPLLVLFAVNNYSLIPSFLLKNRFSRYLSLASLLIFCIWTAQWGVFLYEMVHTPAPPAGGFPVPRHLIPLPVMLDLIYDILIAGINVAIALVFQRIDDTLDHESLLKANAENQLEYLKAQINPHFYMNMLNNIHGMIEIDREKAQEMVIRMSRLMRYMLYESSRSSIPLSEEMDFVSNYIELMRMRYPADKVAVTLSLPERGKMSGISVPPLLFLVFVENAFKHGVSYTSPSVVDVTLEVTDSGRVLFSCSNSLHPGVNDTRGKGIGLINVRRRLSLIYPDAFNLCAEPDGDFYNATLSIPAYETENADN